MLIIAHISMFIDHIYKFLLVNPINPEFGRIAMPIFAYLIAVGMKRTKSQEKYMMRLLIFALVSQIPYTLMVSSNSLIYPENSLIIDKIAITIEYFTKDLNIGFEFLIAVIILKQINKKSLKLLDKILIVVLITYLFELIHKGSWHRTALILMFYHMELKNSKDLLKMFLVMLVIVTNYITHMGIYKSRINGFGLGIIEMTKIYLLEYYSLFALPIIYYFTTTKEDKSKVKLKEEKNYNLEGKIENKNIKLIKQFLKYSIYPIHMIVIVLIKYNIIDFMKF